MAKERRVATLDEAGAPGPVRIPQLPTLRRWEGSNRGQLCPSRELLNFTAVSLMAHPGFPSHVGPFWLKIQIRIGDPADNLRLKRRPRREFQDKVLVEAFTCLEQ